MLEKAGAIALAIAVVLFGAQNATSATTPSPQEMMGEELTAMVLFKAMSYTRWQLSEALKTAAIDEK